MSCRAPDLLPTNSARIDSRIGWSTLGPVAVITVFGLAVRAIPVLASPFPLNDGGLFVRMAETVASSGFSFPSTIDYNGTAIPFAYPPIGIYLVAALHQIVGLSYTDLARFLPLLIAAATVPVVTLICLELLDSTVAALVAGSAYALMPRAWEWLVGGGGLTRSPGVLLALTAILVAIRTMRGQSHAGYLIAGALLGMTGLAHPQAVMFGIASVLFVMAWRRGPSLPRQIGVTLLAAGIVLAPWIVVVLMIHGPAS